MVIECTHVQNHTDHICCYALKCMCLDGLYKNLKLFLDSVDALSLDGSTPGNLFRTLARTLHIPLRGQPERKCRLLGNAFPLHNNGLLCHWWAAGLVPSDSFNLSDWRAALIFVQRTTVWACGALFLGAQIAVLKEDSKRPFVGSYSASVGQCHKQVGIYVQIQESTFHLYYNIDILCTCSQ